MENVRDPKVDILANIPLFMRMDIKDLRVMADRFQVESEKAKVMVFDEGDRGNKFYLIDKGQVEVSKNTHYGFKPLATLGPGDYFGEIALLRRIPRTARITTLTPCVFLTMDAYTFLDIYKNLPARVVDDIQIILQKRLAGQRYLR